MTSIELTTLNVRQRQSLTQGTTMTRTTTKFTIRLIRSQRDRDQLKALYEEMFTLDLQPDLGPRTIAEDRKIERELQRELGPGRRVPQMATHLVSR